MSKIDSPDGSLRRARSRTGHQNLFKNVYEQHLWYEKKFFLAEASYEEIWRVEVMDFYENVQFLIRRQRPGRQGSATHQKLSHFGQNADVCVAPASRTAPLGPQNLFSHHKCYSIRCLTTWGGLLEKVDHFREMPQIIVLLHFCIDFLFRQNNHN